MQFMQLVFVVLLGILCVVDGVSAYRRFGEDQKAGNLIIHLLLLVVLMFVLLQALFELLNLSVEIPAIF